MKKTLIFLLALASVAWAAEPEDKKVNKPLRFLGLTVGAALAAAFLDHPIQEDLFPSRNNDPSRDLRRLGDNGQVAGPVLGTAFFLYGLPMKSRYAKTTGALLWESFLLSGAMVTVTKFTVGRRRPSQTHHASTFDPGQSDGSFPTGHTTAAFSAATVIAERYPKWYIAIPSYAAATGVGFSRMYANKHWLSDVVGGAVLGWSVSHILNKRSKESGESSWMFDGSTLSYNRRF